MHTCKQTTLHEFGPCMLDSYVYTCVHEFMNVYICVYINANDFAWLRANHMQIIRMYTYMHRYMNEYYAYIRECIFICVHKCVDIYMHTYMDTYKGVYTNVYIYAHIHGGIYMCVTNLDHSA